MSVKDLRLAHVNIRSLLPSFDEFKTILLDNDFSVCCISETWLTNTIDSSYLHIENYVLIRKDRAGRGGGVAMYVKQNLNCKLMESNEVIEQLWVSINIRGTTLIVGILIEELENTLVEFTPQCDSIAILGDFNINMLIYDDVSASLLVDSMSSFGLIQIIEHPTRITSSSSTLIDLIFISDRELVADCGVIGVHLADHELIFCALKLKEKKSKPRFRTYRSLKFFNYNDFESDLFSIPFYLMYDMDNVDIMASFLNDHLVNLLNHHMPLITSRLTRAPAPWRTETIRIMQDLRDRAFKRFKHNVTNGAI